MDKKSVITKVLMTIGFVIGGIGGASAAKKIPDELEEIKSELKKQTASDPVETPAEE